MSSVSVRQMTMTQNSNSVACARQRSIYSHACIVTAIKTMSATRIHDSTPYIFAKTRTSSECSGTAKGYR